MRFRRSQGAQEDARQAAGLVEPLPGRVENSSAQGRQRWSTAFLVVGSALFGATALALWNRRTIANLRSQIESRGTPALTEKSRDQEIF